MLVGLMAFCALLMSTVGSIESSISVVLNPDCTFSPLWNVKKEKKRKTKCPGLLPKDFNLVNLYYVQGICIALKKSAPGNWYTAMVEYNHFTSYVCVVSNTYKEEDYCE